MEGYLIDYTGEKHALPVLTAWDVSHGPGTPCDAFEISFVYDRAMLSVLSGAVRFLGVHEGRTVFFGVVDEFSLAADAGGMLATVAGRGLAALLLDNEAEAGEYYGASPSFILQSHVYPWGVTDVKRGEDFSVELFTVSSGASQWTVLEDYFWFCGGTRPRFSRTGTLILDGSYGDTVTIKKDSSVGAALYRERRYGVISRVLVKNKSLGISETVDNEEFLEKGGACRRVITVPRTTYFDAMRHTGEYQIQQSALEQYTLELTLPGQFCAFAGDLAVLEWSPLGVTGRFYVSESRCWADKNSAGTVLTLTRISTP